MSNKLFVIFFLFILAPMAVLPVGFAQYSPAEQTTGSGSTNPFAFVNSTAPVKVQTKPTSQAKMSTIGNTPISYNWTQIWQLFNSKVDWSLWVDEGDGYSKTSGLKVSETKLAENKTDFILNYVSIGKEANYGISFFINDTVISYSKEKESAIIEYRNGKVRFDWSDLAKIDGLSLTADVASQKFAFKIVQEKVKANSKISLDPTVTILFSTSGMSAFGYEYAFQRVTASVSTFFYVFYDKFPEWQSTGWICYARSSDGISWTKNETWIPVAIWAPPHSFITYSVWDNGTHIGIVHSDAEERIFFKLYKVEISGVLTCVNGVQPTVGDFINTYATVAQDSSGYWHIVRANPNGGLYHQKSNDINGISWGSSYTLSSTTMCGNVVPIDNDIDVIYSMSSTDTPLYDRIRYNDGSWSSQRTILSHSYGVTPTSTLYDTFALEAKMLTHDVSTGKKNEYKLVDSSSTWTFVAEYNSAAVWGTLTYVPSNGNLYTTHQDTGGQTHAVVQNKTYGGSWTTSWLPNGWNSGNQGYSAAVLINRKANYGKIVARVYNATGVIALTFDVGTLQYAHWQDWTITPLTGSIFIEQGHSYDIWSMYSQVNTDPLPTGVTMQFYDNAGTSVELATNFNINQSDLVGGNSGIIDGDDYMNLTAASFKNYTSGSDLVYEVRYTVYVYQKGQGGGLNSGSNPAVLTDSRYIDVICDMYLPAVTREYTFTDEFGIYNLGWITETTHVNTAGSVEGGDIFDLYVNTGSPSGSWVNSYGYSKDLQHLKLLPLVEVENYVLTTNLTLSFSFDYAIGEIWYQGITLQLVPTMAAFTVGVSNTGYYWNWTATWIMRGEVLKTEDFWIFPTYGGPKGRGMLVLIPASSAKISSKVWIDLWFNKANGSSVMGGRYNSFYWNMAPKTEPGVMASFGGTDWVRDTRLSKEGMLFSGMSQESGVVHANEIDMVRVGLNVSCNYDNGNRTFGVYNYDVFDMTQDGSLPLDGIQTPIFDESEEPVLPRGGFLGGIFSAFSGFSNWIWNGLIGIYTWLMPFLTGAWNSIYNWLLTLPYVGDLVRWLSVALTNFYAAMTQLFALVTTFFSNILGWITYPFQALSSGMNNFLNAWSAIGLNASQAAEVIGIVVLISFMGLITTAGKGDYGPLLGVIGIVWGLLVWVVDIAYKIVSFLADRILGGLPI